MEIIHPFPPRQFRIVVFDFDGTLSLLRTGWQKIMVDVMVEALGAVPDREPEQALRIRLREMVDQSTGRQTADQMLMLAELVRSCRPLPPNSTTRDLNAEAIRYKQIYLELLARHMATRLASIESGACSAQEFLLAGTREFLQWLAAKGYALCLISGTDQDEVVKEARLLEIDSFFGQRIFGGLDETGAFTKLDAMRRVLTASQAVPEATITFGDGIMDIRSAKKLGAIAIGVASNEEAGAGIQPIKRRQLVAAGADAILGDYVDFQEWTGSVFQ